MQGEVCVSCGRELQAERGVLACAVCGASVCSDGRFEVHVWSGTEITPAAVHASESSKCRGRIDIEREWMRSIEELQELSCCCATGRRSMAASTSSHGEQPAMQRVQQQQSQRSHQLLSRVRCLTVLSCIAGEPANP